MNEGAVAIVTMLSPQEKLDVAKTEERPGAATYPESDTILRSVTCCLVTQRTRNVSRMIQ